MTGDSDNEDGQWHNGNGYETFVKLMSLKQTGPNSFKSAFPAYSPGGGTRAYGGHVYAQAALAASRTVGEGFVIHVCTWNGQGGFHPSIEKHVSPRTEVKHKPTTLLTMMTIERKRPLHPRRPLLSPLHLQSPHNTQRRKLLPATCRRIPR